MELDRPVVGQQLEEAAKEDPALVPARRRREEPFGAPALLVEVDERVQVADGIGGALQANLAGGLGPADLAARLVAFLLVERPEVGLEVDPRRQGDDGADLLALANHRPALAGSRSERRGQRVGGGVAAAEAPQVYDVPGVGVVRIVGVLRRGESLGDGFGHGREVGRAGKDRGVVDVVARPEEDRLRRRRHRGLGQVRVRAQVGPEDRVVGLHLVAVHERDDGNRGVGSAPAGSTTTSVCSWAFVP